MTIGQIAESANRHFNYVSDVMRGKLEPSDWFIEALHAVLSDPELVDEILDLQRSSRRAYLEAQLARLDAS